MWRLSPILRYYVLSVILAASLIAVYSVGTTSFRLHDFLVYLVVMACAVVGVEVLRRQGEPSGVFKDLASAWTLPLALLLPPVYVVAAVIILDAYGQLRVRRAQPHRRIFSAGSICVANVLAGLIFRQLAPTGGSLASWVDRPLATAGSAIACGVLGAAVNSGLVAVAVRLSAPEMRFRDVLLDRSARMLDGLEVMTAVLVTVLAVVGWELIAIALAPVLVLQRSLMHDQLRTAARTDAKTGLLNAATWSQEAERELGAAARSGSSLAVLLIDLDHFKRINDRYGHLIGDEALRDVAEVLRGEVRTYDLAGRFGGEEFVLLLRETGAERAVVVADRVRERIAGKAIGAEGSEPPRITASVGISMRGTDGDDVMELLAAADAALYRAKAAGRDQARLCTELHRLG